MAITSARMQMKRGEEAYFDPDKMLPGEWAVSTDTRIVRICVAPGIVKEIASTEEVKDAILKGLISIQEAEENALINISEGVDNTLSVSGKAADAKVTGEKLGQLSNEIDNLTFFGDIYPLILTEDYIGAGTNGITILERSKNKDGTRYCFYIDLVKGQTINLYLSNLTRCRIIKNNYFYNNTPLIEDYGNDYTYVVDEVLVNNDDVTYYRLNHTATNDEESLVMYLGFNERPVVKLVNSMSQSLLTRLNEVDKRVGCGVYHGSIHWEEPIELYSENRAKTEMIKYNGLMYVDIPKGFSCVLRYYDENKNFIGVSGNVWISETTKINEGNKYNASFFRIIFRKDDDSIITLEDMKIIEEKTFISSNAPEKEINLTVVDEEYLSSPMSLKIKNNEVLNMDNLPSIHVFTPFENDYSTNENTPKVFDMSANEFYQTFYDKYLGWHGDMLVTKKKIGTDETGKYPVWCYDFIPRKPKRKILLTSGLHTYELPASFGLARWVQEYVTSDNEVFAFLRNNVQVSIIPIVNTWGWEQNPKVYGNVNGVNPNRNYNDWSNVWGTFPEYSANPNDENYNEWNVKGLEPFSEQEVKNLIKWVKNNSDASFYIDCHTGLNCHWGEIWCYYSSKSPYLTAIKSAISEISKHIYEVYGKTANVRETVDDSTFIQGYYYENVLGMPFLNIEQSHGTAQNAWDMRINNDSTSIIEYANQIHAYVMEMLRIS